MTATVHELLPRAPPPVTAEDFDEAEKRLLAFIVRHADDPERSEILALSVRVLRQEIRECWEEIGRVETERDEARRERDLEREDASAAEEKLEVVRRALKEGR